MTISNPTEQRRQQRAALQEHEVALATAVRGAANLNPRDWPDEALLAHTRRGLDRAVLHGLDTQPDILGFLTFRHLFGERFDEVPAVRQYLARTDLPSDQRMQRMMLELPFDIWQQVGQSTPPGPSPEGWAEPAREAGPVVQGQGLEPQADDSQRSEPAKSDGPFVCTLSSHQEYLRELQKKKAAWAALRDEVLALQPIVQDERWQKAASVLVGGQGLVATEAAARCAEALQGLGVNF